MQLFKITSAYRSKLIIGAYRKYIKANQIILDVGCGNGLVSHELKKYFHIGVTGCDIISYLQYDIPFIKMKSKKILPFAGKTFDQVMFNDVLHHMEKTNQKIILQEALRIANSVLIFEVIPTFKGKLFDYLMNKIHNPKMNLCFTFRTKDQWEKVFRDLQVNYSVIEVPRPILYPFSHIAFHLTKK